MNQYLNISTMQWDLDAAKKYTDHSKKLRVQCKARGFHGSFYCEVVASGLYMNSVVDIIRSCSLSSVFLETL